MKTATCIVGIVEEGIVWMGGDSAGVSYLDTLRRADVKVFLRKGKEPMIMGYTSSFRMGQLLRFKLEIPERSRDKDVYEYMVTDYIDAVRKCFKDGGFGITKNEERSGGTYLVGYAGRLFTIYDDFQVAENMLPYASCGCGEDYAMGVLYATSDTNTLPQNRIRLALECAEEFSGGVKGPFVIEKLGGDDGKT